MEIRVVVTVTDNGFGLCFGLITVLVFIAFNDHTIMLVGYYSASLF